MEDTIHAAHAAAPADLTEQVRQWREKFGEVYELKPDVDPEEDQELGGISFIFRKPGRVQLSRFAKAVTSDTLKALHTLVFDCLLAPDKERVEDLFGRRPGLIISLGGELQKLIGTNQDFFVKPL